MKRIYFAITIECKTVLIEVGHVCPIKFNVQCFNIKIVLKQTRIFVIDMFWIFKKKMCFFMCKFVLNSWNEVNAVK